MRIPAIVCLIMLSGILSAQDAPVKLRPLDLKRIKVAPMRVLPPLVSKMHQHPSKPYTTEVIAAINKPATVRVISKFTGTIQYQPMQANVPNLKAAVSQIEQAASLGQIANTNADKLVALLQIIAGDMNAFLFSSAQITEEYLNLTGTGSGMIVTPQGHVVTNAHVVSTATPTITQNLIVSSIMNRTTELSKFLQQVYPVEGGLPEGAEQILVSILETFYSNNYFKLSNIEAEYTIQTGYTMQLPVYSMKATLLSVGESVPGKDAAVLKISGLHGNLPTVAFGDDKALKTGEPIYVMGYPAVVEDNEMLSQGVMREPSYTPGIVSARQRTTQGWEAIQITASASHGNSGGPVFNQYGEVVGMLTFGSMDKSIPGVLIQGFSFIVPNTVINEFIIEAGVQPEMSANAIAYKEALALQNEEDFKKALTKLESIKSSYPQFPYLDTEINAARTRVEQNSAWYDGLWEGLSTRNKIIVGVAGLFVVVWIGRKIFG